jgi:hypothetical protein
MDPARPPTQTPMVPAYAVLAAGITGFGLGAVGRLACSPGFVTYSIADFSRQMRAPLKSVTGGWV